MFPQLTEEHRKALVKDVSKRGEEAKVAVRNVRRDSMDDTKKLKKNNEITEDDQKDGEKKLHVELTDSFAKRLLESVSAASKLRAIAVSQGDAFTDVIIEIAKPDTNTRSAFDDLF